MSEDAGGSVAGLHKVTHGTAGLSGLTVLFSQVGCSGTTHTKVLGLHGLGKTPVKQPVLRRGGKLVRALPEQVMGEIVATALFAQNATPP